MATDNKNTSTGGTGSRIRSSDPNFEEILSRYLDDALSPDEAQGLETCLAEDPEAMATLERYAMAQELLRQTYKAELEQVDFGQMWSRIEQGIAQIEPVPARAPALSLLARLKAWWSAGGWQPVGYGLAAAVALLLTLRALSPAGDPEVASPGTGEVAQRGDPTQAPAGIGVEATPVNQTQVAQATVITEGTEVNDVSGGQDATVMVIHSPENATIIWVHEDEGQGGSSI